MIKWVSQSRAYNLNIVNQTKILESKVKEKKSKRSHMWDHFTSKAYPKWNNKDFFNYYKQKYFTNIQGHGTMAMLCLIDKCRKNEILIIVNQS